MDVQTVLWEAGLSAGLEALATDALRRFGVGKGPPPLRIDRTRLRTALLQHLEFVQRWAEQITFREIHRALELTDHFVDLECRLGVRESRRETRPRTVLRVTELASTVGSAAILGRPGAGKTTTLRRIAQLALSRRERGESIVPLVLQLRDLAPSESIPDALLAVLGVYPEFAPHIAEPDRQKLKHEMLRLILAEIGALVLLDGLDETCRETRQRIEVDLEHLLEGSAQYRCIVTCRTADYRRHFPRTTELVLQPLSRADVQEFAHRWLGSHATRFVDAVYDSPFSGLEVLPLTVAHLSAVYMRTGSIPAKPRSVYRRVVRLLLEEWDEQRGIRRQSSYAGFDIDRKEAFLYRLAFELTIAGRRGSFSHADLRTAYERLHAYFDLPASQAEHVAREIESHSGIVLALGHDEFEFAHLAIQEYLCAEYLVRLRDWPASRIVELPEEMAIVVCLSSEPTQVLEEVLARFGKSDTRAQSFLHVFAARLAAEKPDFQESEGLGWTLLAMALRQRGESQGAILLEESFRGMLGAPGARPSVIQAIKASTSRSVPTGFFVRPRGAVATFAQRQLKGAPRGEFFVHRGVLRHLGLWRE